MDKPQDKDTRYFVELDCQTLAVVGYGYAQKQTLDKGRQNNPAVHRLFLTRGQYNAFTERCSVQLQKLE